MGPELLQSIRAGNFAEGSVELLRLALAVGDLGLWQWDHATNTVHLDDRACAMLSLDPAQQPVASAALLTQLHADDLAQVQREITAYSSGQKPVCEQEFRFALPQQGWIWLRLKGCPVERDGLRPLRTAGTITEITAARQRELERSEAERSLRESADRLDLVIDAAGLGIWDWDIPANRITTNAQYMTMLGYPPAEAPLRASYLQTLVHPDDRALVWDALRRALNGTGTIAQAECRFRQRSGEYRWIRGSGRVMQRDRQGRPLRMLGVHVDIDTQNRDAAERRRLQQILQYAVDTMPQRVWWKDREGRFLGANRALLADTGLNTPEDLIGRTDAETTWATSAPAIVADDRRVMESGQPIFDLIERLDSPNGRTRWVRTNKIPLHDAAGEIIGTLGTFEDITAEREREVELRAARDAAQAANSAKSEFLARMSHEIRTPMNGVIGMTQLALETNLSPFQRDCLETVRTSADALLTIINDILDFSKIEARQMALSPAPFSPRQLTRRILSLLDVRAREKGIHLKAAVDDEIPEVLIGDEVRLGQILTNLLGNAIKFTPPGGRVQLALRVVSSVERALMLGVRVSDTGIGIAPANLERIFEPFRQAEDSTSRHFGGTGLGLSISRQLVELMDGSISVESTIGSGTTFSFVCRLGIGDALALEPADQSLSCDGPPLRVLLVEDHPVNLKLARHVLEKLNCQVHTAINGHEAVSLACGTLPAPYHLVLMDCQMPEMNGWEATAAIRDFEARHGLPSVPIVALTANALEGDRQKCLNAGMNDYLSKPVDRRKLAQILARLRHTLPAPQADSAPHQDVSQVN